jgi:hypothetical protein
MRRPPWRVLWCGVGATLMMLGGRLAAAGLLWDRQAMTHWAYAYLLENLGAHYVQRRWVKDAGDDPVGKKGLVTADHSCRRR